MPESTDDLEGRVRALERADAGRDKQDELRERRERELYGLPELYGRLDERIKNVEGDIDGAHVAYRDLDEKVDRERDERIAADHAHDTALEKARSTRDEELQTRDAVLRAAIEEKNSKIVVAVLSFMGTFVVALGGVIAAYFELKGH